MCVCVFFFFVARINNKKMKQKLQSYLNSRQTDAQNNKKRKQLRILTLNILLKKKKRTEEKDSCFLLE